MIKQVICDKCGYVASSAFDFILVSVQKSHEERNEGHKTSIAPLELA